MGHAEVTLAIARAVEDARTLPAFPKKDGLPRSRRVAMGDPQAPLETVMNLLDGHGLLGEAGRLAPDAELVSMGDHFDFGSLSERARAGEAGTELLAWLAAHPSDQVTILIGNHDLARVGELARFDDDSFREAQVEADAGYWAQAPIRAERDYRARWGVPSWEMIARDFSNFRVEQRTLVTALLQTKRFRVAYAVADDLLLTHAGVTLDELDALGASFTDAHAIADALNTALESAVASWQSGPLSVGALHQPGDAAGEGVGMFYHRPVRVQGPVQRGHLRRRFDVRRLPRGLTQAVGHTRDLKSRKLLQLDEAGAADGRLRHVAIEGEEIVLGAGRPPPATAESAVLVFLDGGMNDVFPASYELLDLDTREARRR